MIVEVQPMLRSGKLQPGLGVRRLEGDRRKANDFKGKEDGNYE